MSLTSDEVNFLVYRYLLEAGFTHAAYVFGCESHATKSGINGKVVPVGALVSFIQKGFQYMELEANLNEEGTDVYGEYTSLSARDILTKDIEELKDAVRELKEQQQEEEADFLADGPLEVPPAAIASLAGHSGDVISLAWCPTANLLASAGSDATARIWDLQDESSSSSSSRSSSVCVHPGRGEAADVTAVDWSPDGQQLATGCGDGGVRVFNRNGSLRMHLIGHRGGIFMVRWNKKGDLLVSCSLDGSVIAWDARSASVRQQMTHHRGAVLDIDWRNNTMFASSSQDGSIAVLRLGEPKPVRQWHKAHEGDINSIRWDPGSKVLASGSDDARVKLWSLTSERPLHVLEGHAAQVGAVRWGTSTSGRPCLASSSYDGTVRVWDTETGTCLHTLPSHTQAEGGVAMVNWSPDGTYLASGDADGHVCIWSARRGCLVRKLEAGGSIFDLRWNKDGRLLAASAAEGRPILVANLRK